MIGVHALAVNTAQVLWHSLVDLVTNAAKHTATGHIEVRLSARLSVGKVFVKVCYELVCNLCLTELANP